MSEQKSASPLKILLLVGLLMLAGIAGLAGLAFYGWTLVRESAQAESGHEVDGTAGGTSGRQGGGGPDQAEENSPGGIAGWLHSANKKLAQISAAREESSQQTAANLEGPKMPVVATQPISADERIYQQYINRKDVLVMVEYYADW